MARHLKSKNVIKIKILLLFQDEVAEDEDKSQNATMIELDGIDPNPMAEVDKEASPVAVVKKSTNQPTGRKRTQSQIQIDQEIIVLKKAMNTLEQVSSSPARSEQTADDIFGQYVASELKGIKDEYLKKLIKHRIHCLV